MTAPTPVTPPADERGALEGVLAAHRYRDVLGDYEEAPYYKHFGCSCGWWQNIAGMSGWRSWVAAHDTHLAAVLAPVVAERVEAAVEAAARRIEDKRNKHWQYHLRAHPYADAKSCPVDYGKHDAYAVAARIVRAGSQP